MRTRKSGFTLIELLVVVAIIAILAAILFPVFASMKAKSRQAACANNIKQIVTAMLNYADDWGNRLPGLNVFGNLVDPYYALSHSRTPYKGRGPLWSYVKTKAIYVCPDDLQHRRPFDPMPPDFGGYNYTYTVNSYMTYASVNRKLADTKGELVSKSKNPSRTVLLVDENTDPYKGECTVNDAHFATGDRTCDRHPGPRVMQRGYAATTWRVDGVANVGYLDGHMEIVPGLVRWDSAMGREIFWK